MPGCRAGGPGEASSSAQRIHVGPTWRIDLGDGFEGRAIDGYRGGVTQCDLLLHFRGSVKVSVVSNSLVLDDCPN